MKEALGLRAWDTSCPSRTYVSVNPCAQGRTLHFFCLWPDHPLAANVPVSTPPTPASLPPATLQLLTPLSHRKPRLSQRQAKRYSVTKTKRRSPLTGMQATTSSGWQKSPGGRSDGRSGSSFTGGSSPMPRLRHPGGSCACPVDVGTHCTGHTGEERHLVPESHLPRPGESFGGGSL